jgi:hypothetical protein
MGVWRSVKPAIIQHHGPVGPGRWHVVRWDGKAVTAFVLNETDENKAMQALAVDTE